MFKSHSLNRMAFFIFGVTNSGNQESKPKINPNENKTIICSAVYGDHFINGIIMQVWLCKGLGPYDYREP
jgi:hypothetical protein